MKNHEERRVRVIEVEEKDPHTPAIVLFAREIVAGQVQVRLPSPIDTNKGNFILLSED